MQERYGLLTNDSVIAAMALRLEADALVSADTRFKVVKELTIYAPSDLKNGLTDAEQCCGAGIRQETGEKRGRNSGRSSEVAMETNPLT